MAEDAFAEALEDRENLPWVKRGLTDGSYKKYTDMNVPGHGSDNSDLATLGDSLLKFMLTLMLMDREEQLSKARQRYETDEVLTKVIGRHYGILGFMYYDRKDPNFPRDYGWEPKGSANEDRPHKHVATAVEGTLGGIYMEHRDMEEIRGIVERWKSLIDTESKLQEAVRHPGSA
ncbi:ribonuclease III domain-containing protein [Methanomassiliicoccales archaeon LGM-DZ1]|nr:ribonuclease III domain-containing protein [Methanomassiliicoccales archaeon LGM-DZ1]